MTADDYPRQYAKSLAGSDHEAFWRNIAADPTDDLPPLVYADFLDDHGHGELAKLIRRSIHEGHGPTYIKDPNPHLYPPTFMLPPAHVAQRPDGWRWANEADFGSVFDSVAPHRTYPKAALSVFTPAERSDRGDLLPGPHKEGLVRFGVYAEPDNSRMFAPSRSFVAPFTVAELHALAATIPSGTARRRMKQHISNPNRFIQPKPAE